MRTLKKLFVISLIITWCVIMWNEAVPETVKEDITKTVNDILFVLLIIFAGVFYFIASLFFAIIEKIGDVVNKGLFPNQKRLNQFEPYQTDVDQNEFPLTPFYEQQEKWKRERKEQTGF